MGARLIRAATPADADRVHALLVRHAAAVDEPAPPRGSLDAEWAAPGFDARRDHWVAERDGDVAGYAALRPGGAVVLRGEPDRLLDVLAARAAERGDADAEAIVTTRDTAGLRAFEAAGWRRVRDVRRMWLELDGEPAEPRFPADATVRRYAAADARRLHALVALAYARNNERIDPFEPWLHAMTAHGDFDPALWHLAESAGTLVACCLTWAPFERQGWVKDLAVHPGHRRRGLGEALLDHAARAYRRLGVERVGLKVDADNPTGAGRLYERLGYRTDRVYAVLRPGTP